MLLSSDESEIRQCNVPASLDQIHRCRKGAPHDVLREWCSITGL